ncbi:lysosome-associated membrane glycoprotein 1-like isoform X2 [Chrysoperla carnea]|nr:lysosome-associated membrane glycoprotein 1-like isoform X2 [Chrysoperla carnea]
MLKMKYLILFLSCIAVCLGADTSTTPSSVTSSTTNAPPSTSTAAPNTTTAAPTTTSTVAPAPNTTTVAPTTSTTAPNVTTVAPTTSTVAPTPKPVEPTMGTWVLNKTGQVCIVAQMALQVKITYKTNSNVSMDDFVNLPSANETTFDGVCGNDTQNLIIKWNNNSLELSFAKNVTEKEFMLNKLNLTVQVQDKLMEATLDKPSFITPLSMSYKCDREETLKLVTPNGNDTILVNVQHLQLEAFRTDNTTVKFSTAQECRVPTQDIVPIAVGCALAALVLIVLVAYLVGRRRVTARGYLSI